MGSTQHDSDGAASVGSFHTCNDEFDSLQSSSFLVSASRPFLKVCNVDIVNISTSSINNNDEAVITTTSTNNNLTLESVASLSLPDSSALPSMKACSQQLKFTSHDAFSFWQQSVAEFNIILSVKRSEAFSKDIAHSNKFPYKRITFSCGNCKAPKDCGLLVKYYYSSCDNTIIVDCDMGKETFIIFIVIECLSESKNKYLFLNHPGIHYFRNDATNVIKKQAQLSVKEKELVNILGIAHTSIPNMKSALRLYSDKIFDADLLYRSAKKARLDMLGDEQGSISKFMAMGAKISAEGGKFIVEHDDVSMKITGAFVQKPIERKLCEEYASTLIYLDATHNTTR